MTTHDPVAALGHVSVMTNAHRRSNVQRLVERESTDLLSYFLRRTSSPDDAADLLNDTLLVIWRRERSIPADAEEARMWMFGVARRVLSGHRRSSARRTALARRLGEELTVATTTSAAETDDVREAIAQLPAVDREIVRLHYWEGFALNEVASIMSMRPATVRSRLARARARLKQQLDG